MAHGFNDPQIEPLSCASPGNCAIGGAYDDQHSHLQALVAGDRNAT